MSAAEVIAKLKAKSLKLATAESCTGGLISAEITSLAGSSEVFDRGFVTYSNESKTQLLGVPANLIESYGAVSAEVAKAMAQGAIKNSNAQVAISITGIAGPSGSSAEKPVGLVYIGISRYADITKVLKYHFSGNRAEVRQQAVAKAFELLLQAI